mgnify:CR=1 FL=1
MDEMNRETPGQRSPAEEISQAEKGAAIKKTLRPDQIERIIKSLIKTFHGGVERVDVDSTIPGETYTITITNKGSLARGSQAYSLIVSGTGGVSYSNSASLTGGAKVDSLSFTNIRFKNSTGCKTFTDNTRFTGNIQARQVLPIFIRTAACDATVNPRIIKVYIYYNNY